MAFKTPFKGFREGDSYFSEILFELIVAVLKPPGHPRGPLGYGLLATNQRIPMRSDIAVDTTYRLV